MYSLILVLALYGSSSRRRRQYCCCCVSNSFLKSILMLASGSMVLSLLSSTVFVLATNVYVCINS